MKIKELNELASNMVGDGKSPNLFFVTLAGNVVTITTDFDIAHKEWKSLTLFHIDSESMLEDRKYGVICSREPVNEGSKKLISYDDSTNFLNTKKKSK